MKKLLLLFIMSCSLHAMKDQSDKKINKEHSTAYNNVLPAIEYLVIKLNKILDEAEKNEDFSSCVEGRITKDEIDLNRYPELATKQGLLLVSHIDKPHFKILTPDGGQLIGGYKKIRKSLVNSLDFETIKIEFHKVLQTEPYHHFCGEIWDRYDAYKIVRVDDKRYPDLMKGKTPTKEMGYG